MRERFRKFSQSRLTQVIIIKSFAALLLLSSQVLPARVLGVDGFGTFSYLNSVLAVLTFLAIWGTDRLCLREVSLFRKPTQKKSNRSHASSATSNLDPNVSEFGQRLFGVYAILLFNTIFVGVGLWVYMGSQFANERSPALLAVCLGLVLTRAFSQVNYSVTQGLSRVVFAEVCFSLGRPLLVVLPLLVFYLCDFKASVQEVLLLFLISYLVVGLLLHWRASHQSFLKLDFDLSEIPTVYKLSFMFFVVGIGVPLLQNINTIELGIFESRTEVALYSACARLVSLVLMGLVSANLLIAPKLPPLFQAGDIAGMRLIIRNNNKIVLLLTLVPVIGLAILAEKVLFFYGEEFVPAALILRTLVIGQVFSVFCGPVVLISTLTGLQQNTAATVLAACIFNAFLCLILIPRFGALGAAYASVFSAIFLNGFLAWTIKRKHGLNVTMLNIIR